MYCSILEKFEQNYKKFSKLFQSFIDKKDFISCHIEAHSLKGVAGNISAHDLQLAASALEEACMHEDTARIRLILNTVEDELNIVLKSIRQTIVPRDSKLISVTKAKKLDPLEIASFIKVLDKNLSESDPVESETNLLKIKQIIGSRINNTEIQTLFENIEAEVNQYNYDEARDILNQFAGKIK